MTPEERRLRELGPGALADEALTLREAFDAVKAEAIRRGLKRAEGLRGRITLSPPGTQDRTDRTLILTVMGISEAEFISRFCHEVKTDWRITVTPRRVFAQAA